MQENRTPALAVEEEWIVKYRAALNAELTEQSHTVSIHKLLRRTLEQFVPASEWILHQCVRPRLERAFADVGFGNSRKPILLARWPPALAEARLSRSEERFQGLFPE